MAEVRKIKKVSKSKPTVEGRRRHLKRAFGFSPGPAIRPVPAPAYPLPDYLSGPLSSRLPGILTAE